MDELKLGMVGLDTSHCPAFAGLLNDEGNKHHMEGARITAAYPGGSRAFSSSINRVEGFTTQMKNDYGVKIVDTIEEAAEDVDAIFLQSVDGRQHLEQFEKLAPFGKPVFVDKPFATSAEDAERILELSGEHNSPVFSCSALRYDAGIAGLGADEKVIGCGTFGPVRILTDYPGFFWYGVHCAEILFSKMGPGCVEVNVSFAESADVITGTWKDGRMGTVYGYRIEGLGTFGCTVFGEKNACSGRGAAEPPKYAMLMPEILKFFRTGVSPVSVREMLEIVAFLESANRSRETGNRVKLQV